MKQTFRAIAAAELLLVAPATVFLAAIFVRNVTPLPKEPAETAHRIVLWFAGLPVQLGLWGLLTALPLAVLVVGVGTLLLRWQHDESFRHSARAAFDAVRGHLAMAVIAATTLVAGMTLAFVAVHMMTD